MAVTGTLAVIAVRGAATAVAALESPGRVQGDLKLFLTRRVVNITAGQVGEHDDSMLSYDITRR